MTADLTVSEIVERLAPHAADICARLLPAGKKDGHEWHVGDVHNTPGKSCAVHLTGPKAGLWSDFATGESGDILDLIQAARGTDKAGAVAWAKTYLGIGNAENSAHRTVKTSEPAPCNRAHAENSAPDHQRFALEIWRASVNVDRTEVETYLCGRGITLPLPPSLRFHSNLKHTKTGLYFPAMVAGVQASTGEVISIHRTYLQPGGRGKAVVNEPKMALGTLEDGAVRLAPAGKALGLAEGIETGLSAMQLFEIPVWACLSCGRFVDVAISDQVIEVQIFADNGEPGRKAALKAARRFMSTGKRVVIRRPPDSFGDWNDVLPHWHERPAGEWEF